MSIVGTYFVVTVLELYKWD